MAKLIYKTAHILADLNRLLSLLKGLKNINIEGLENLETELNKNFSSQEKWTLKTKLIFKNINKVDLKIPSKIEKDIKEILLELKVNITENSYSKNTVCDSIEQSKLIKYGVNIITYGKKSTTASSYKMSWHLDKHIRSDISAEGRGKGFTHPEYHFNMGGFALTKETDFDYGQVLLIDTPRLIHPPLDIVLSIDFVLKNFYGIRVKNLTDSTQYNNIISNTKKRLWRPYYIALSNQWESSRFQDLEIQDNFGHKLQGQM
jgi:hypothetical protein